MISIGRGAVGYLLIVTVTLPALAQTADTGDGKPTVVRFGKGAWDRSQWKLLRMANQTAPKEFSQFEDAIGSTRTTFSEQDYSRESDNAILIHDVGTAEAQVDVSFAIGQGFRGHSAPGVCLAPNIKDGMLESSLAVFVADYAMAAWYQDTAPDGKTVRYRHLVQLARFSDPARPHVLRCRISKKEASVALQVDDSDVTVFTFVGNPALSFIGNKVSSLVGVWACHGACKFHEMKIHRPGLLPFLVRKSK